MSTGLAAKVDQRQEEIWHLEAEVTRQYDKSLVSLVVFLSRIHGRPFDTVGM